MSDNGPMAVSRKSAVSLKVIASYAEEAIVAVAEDRSLERGVFPVIFPQTLGPWAITATCFCPDSETSLGLQRRAMGRDESRDGCRKMRARVQSLVISGIILL